MSDGHAALLVAIARELPTLSLIEANSPFDEALIEIGSHEEETILIECPESAALARRLVAAVNGHLDLVTALVAATHALRSYQYGDASPELASSVADHCAAVLAQVSL